MTRHDIFISYRCPDVACAQLLRDRLASTYGATTVFLDTESIESGEDFPDRLEVELKQMRVLLVVIGPDWLIAKDEHGRRKLDMENDWGRKEVAAGLSNETVTVIPLLLDDCELPKMDALPKSLHGIVRKNAIQLRMKYFDNDVRLLIKQLDSRGLVAKDNEQQSTQNTPEGSFPPVGVSPTRVPGLVGSATPPPTEELPITGAERLGRTDRRKLTLLAFVAGIGAAALANTLLTPAGNNTRADTRLPTADLPTEGPSTAAQKLTRANAIECELTFASIGLKDGADDDSANRAGREAGVDKCPSGKGGTDPEMSSSNRDCEAYAALAEDFNSKHPNVKVSHKAYRHEWIKAHLREFLERDDVPDVLVWSAGTHVEPYEHDLAGIDKKPEDLTALKKTFMKHVQFALSDLNEDAHFLPFKTYVWAFYYRPETWKSNAHRDRPWAVPNDLGQLVDLAKLMKGSKLEPIAFGNVHGWPALGYFDAINMRTANFDCHQKLLARTEHWKRNPNNQHGCNGVEDTLKEWKKLIPYYSANWQRKSYRDAAHQLAHGDAGMFFIGGFFVEDLNINLISRIRAFEFPRKSPRDRFTGVDAPVDGFVFPKKGESTERRACAELQEADARLHRLSRDRGGLSIIRREEPRQQPVGTEGVYDL